MKRLILVASFLVGCVSEDVWWEGTDEPSSDGKADGSGPLTIFLSRTQTNIRRILDHDSLGTLSRGRTGTLSVDGLGLSEKTVLVFDGTVFHYDGTQAQHRFVIDPWHVTREQGAANPGGFLWVDFKSDPSAGNQEFGRKAGVFRGQVVATESIAVGDPLPDNLVDLYIRPKKFGERPPNVIRDANIFITPNVALAELLPTGGGADPCLGDRVVDRTTADQTLRVKVALEGFPAGKPIQLDAKFITPRNTSHSIAGAVWDWVSGWAASEQTLETQTMSTTAGSGIVAFADYVLPDPGFGSDVFGMEIEIDASSSDPGGPFASSGLHHVIVAEPGKEVVVDQTELCPIDDVPCHALRDKDAPDNVVARRAVIENSALEQGLYNTIARPLGRCAGGDEVSGGQNCTVYRESSDSELSANVAAELQFELNVSGQAMGQQSWSTEIPGVGSAQLQAALKATFKLDADLKASYKTSVSWENHHSLDVIYDPNKTQIQWWRIVTPRLRYLAIAKFNACGNETSIHDIYLSDLRDSRVAIACEQVPSASSACHAVEPTGDALAACPSLLIPPTSEQGKTCLAQ